MKALSSKPLWWHPGSSYAIRREKNVIKTFENSHFDVLIFLKNDRTRIPGTLLNYIDSSYHIDRKSDYLDIYTKAIN